MDKDERKGKLTLDRSPCADCPEKGCGSKHDSCEPYQAWFAERKELLKRKSDAYAIDTYYRARVMKQVDWKRKHNKDDSGHF